MEKRKGKRDWTELLPWKGDKAPEIRKQRRKGIGFPQGLMRKNRKVRGPDCKIKFPVDLKPKWRNAQNESWRVFQALQHCFRAQVQDLNVSIYDTS
jgi:hypothetical protein